MDKLIKSVEGPNGKLWLAYSHSTGRRADSITVQQEDKTNTNGYVPKAWATYTFNDPESENKAIIKMHRKANVMVGNPEMQDINLAPIGKWKYFETESGLKCKIFVFLDGTYGGLKLLTKLNRLLSYNALIEASAAAEKIFGKK